MLLAVLQVLLFESFPFHFVVVLQLNQGKLNVSLLLLSRFRIFSTQQVDLCLESLASLLSALYLKRQSFTHLFQFLFIPFAHSFQTFREIFQLLLFFLKLSPQPFLCFL
jgi:hypothetical protein